MTRIEERIEAAKAALQNASDTLAAVREESNQMKEAKEKMRNKIAEAIGTEDQVAVEKVVEAVEAGSYAAVEDAVRAAVEEKEEKKMTMKERIQAASKKAQDKIGSVNLEEIGMKAAQKSGYGTGYAAATVVYGTKELASKVANRVVGNKYVQGYTNSVKEGWTAGRTNIYAAKAAAEIVDAEVANC